MIFLESIDHQFFHFLNSVIGNFVFDLFFPFISNLSNQFWFPRIFLPATFAIWIYFERLKAVKVIVALLLLAGLSDFVGYHLLKKHFDRTRPNNHPQVTSVLRLPHSPQSGSFPSNHAMSTFAMATLLLAVYPRKRWYFLSFAALVAISRVYVGVHFPSDVIGGALLGTSLGYGFSWILSRRTDLISSSTKN